MTDQQDEWGPWIKHDGKGCPVSVGTLVRVEYARPCHFASGKKRTGEFGRIRVFVCRGHTSWTYGNPSDKSTWHKNERGDGKAVPIIRYQVKRPLGLTLLQQIAQDVSEPEVVGHE